MAIQELSAQERDQLVRRLAQDVTYLKDPPYFELETALDHLICVIRGLPCASEPVDWAKIIGEALNLRPQH